MNKAWIYVVAGGTLEIFWALFLKLSDGFSNLGWSVIAIVLCVISFYLFAKGMNKLPAGVAYTTYTGIGAVGTIIFGILFLHESISAPKIIFSALLIFGILGLKLESKEGE
ncbi:MAG: DMT family transporter [Lachnospiraceae bacterium]